MKAFNSQFSFEGSGFKDMGILRVIIGFNIGIGLNLLYKNHFLNPSSYWGKLLILNFIIFVLLIYFNFDDPILAFQGAIILFCLAKTPYILKSKWLILAGEIPFSFYVIHHIFQLLLYYGLEKIFKIKAFYLFPSFEDNFLAWFSISTILALLLLIPSYLGYKLVEVPCREIVKSKAKKILN